MYKALLINPCLFGCDIMRQRARGSEITWRANAGHDRECPQSMMPYRAVVWLESPGCKSKTLPNGLTIKFCTCSLFIIPIVFEISFKRNDFVQTKYFISFKQNDFVRTKWFRLIEIVYLVQTKWFRSNEMISFNRNSLSRSNEMISFKRNTLSRSNKMISFERNHFV